MAVEFRCPECRAKLRLPAAPEPGEEVECPKCGHPFPAPDPDGPADAPAKKKKPAAADDEPPKKDKDKPADKGGDEKKGKPKKKRSKKKTTNPALLAGIVLGGMAFLGVLAGGLYWYMKRQPAAVEMLHYVPEDAEVAVGYNAGHVQKYSKLNETVDKAFEEAPWHKAADAAAKALGLKLDELLDYVVTGQGRSGAAIVLRTKKEIDPAGLAKLPGAKEKSGDGGLKYYVVANIPGLYFDSPRVFAPTRRLIVFCPGGTDMKEDAFGKVLKGNSGNPEGSVPGRMGALGNRVTRGTYWVMVLFKDKFRPTPPPPVQEGSGSSGERDYLQVVYETTSGAKGTGYKVSVGSREVRFEWATWYGDKDKAQSTAAKWKESALAKGDEGDPPRWWKSYFAPQMGQKKVGEEMLSNIGFTSSGEVFVARTSVDTKLIMMTLSGLVGKVGGLQAGTNPAPPKTTP